MKIALLLSGLPRKVKESYETNWRHLIENYDIDVYLHTWKDNTFGCNWQDVLDTYTNIKSLQIQSPFKFTHFKIGIQLPHNDTSRPLPEYDVMSCFRQLPMIYSWQKVYQTVYDSGVSYDLIIRSRYDLNFITPINLNLIDSNYINHAPGGVFFDDNLTISNQSNSEKLYHNIFYKLIEYSKETGVLNSAEQSWTMLLQKSDLINKCIVNPNLSFRLLRDNLLWWGDKNGNII
jgi:hypothetical protein